MRLDPAEKARRKLERFKIEQAKPTNYHNKKQLERNMTDDLPRY